MQRDSSPVLLPNTLRDSNEIPTASQGFVVPSEPSIEAMNVNSETRHSIIRPVDSANSLPPRIPSPNRHRVSNKPLVRSIVRPNESDDERHSHEPPEPISNGNIINENDSSLGATGFDPTRLAELDADAQYALQLQEEEYSRESFMSNRHQYLPFRVEPDEESASANAALSDSDIPQFANDEQLAAFLQEREDRKRQQYRRPPLSFFPIRQRSNPASTQTSETDETENEHNPPLRFHQRQPIYNEDDDDDDNPPIHNTQALLQFLASQGHTLPEGFPPFFAGFRRGHRRTGNLQDTEEDFGPEDYERLLQLDDSINKKKLTQNQIDTLHLESFKPQSSNTDEENKCGICLELFEETQTLRRFPCRHAYHKECADRWLQENNVCPICRVPPVAVQPTSNSRPHRGPGGWRRPTHNNRNSSNRNNNSNSNNNHPHHRRGPGPQHQS